MTRAFLGIGSNLGDRAGYLDAALAQLGATDGIEVVAVSPVYENRAVGMGDAADFLNAVAEARTSLGPEVLLDRLLAIERGLGRVRGAGWEPRTIDLDILHWGAGPVATPRLSVPHPRLLERDFVVVPLADLAPDLEIAGRRVGEVAAETAGSGLRRLPCRSPVFLPPGGKKSF